jgi:NAD(P)-dependent dehydrogenase (short-subunit alcohol dehydrogenase family)
VPLGKTKRDPFFGGRVALVTGGTRGLGIAITRALLARGAKVAVCARDPDEVAAAFLALGSSDRVLARVCDVTDAADVAKFVAEIEAGFGPVGIAINNAGTIVVGPYADMTVEDIRRVVDVNFFGAVNVMAAVIPGMRSRKRGSIVNVASVGGVIPVPHLAAYCAGKFALNGFSLTVGAEARRDGVSISVVNPGLMRTGSPGNATFKGQSKAEYGWFALSDSLPMVTISAERAARDILKACRRRRPFTVLSLPARLGVLAQAFAPNAVALLMRLVNGVLPKSSEDRKHSARGHESESSLVPSALTGLTQEAELRNNELPARRGAFDLPG